VNAAGKELIERLTASSRLTGIECGPPEPTLWKDQRQGEQAKKLARDK